MYPVLKHDVRLKKCGKFCWIFAPEEGIDSAVPQYAAFILTLMDGRWTTDDLKLVVSTVYNTDSQLCNKIVDEVISEYGICIEWRQSAGQEQMRYDAQDFLFNGMREADFEQERLESPNILTVSITRACNFQCIYCFNASGRRMPDELTGNEWCNVIEQARQLGIFQILITGGEPTLRADLPLILRKLKASDLQFKLFTNGACLTDELCELLAGKSVQVSLDTADREIHKRLTGVDTFNTVVANIARLVKCGIHVSVKSVITTLNTDGLTDLYSLCEDTGVKLLAFDKFDVSSRGRGGLDLCITDRHKKYIQEMFYGHKAASKMQLNLNLGEDTWTKSSDVVGCGAFRSSMLLSPCGDLIGCEKMIDIPEMTMGNIRRNKLKDLWNSPKIDSFIKNIRNTEDKKCRECSVFTKCRTGCFAEKNYYKKPIFGADPRCKI
jgi:pyrroloquinoline quinone biosynthesis protein E